MNYCHYIAPRRRGRTFRFAAALLAGSVGMLLPLAAGERGSEVIVVFNTRVPESKGVADYYARRRQVPTEQIFGLELPTSETMTRREFLDQLQLVSGECDPACGTRLALHV